MKHFTVTEAFDELLQMERDGVLNDEDEMDYIVAGLKFETIEEALAYAAKLIYVTAKDRMRAKINLEKGNNVILCYGFKTVEIEVMK
jgi:hypothetical protein